MKARRRFTKIDGQKRQDLVKPSMASTVRGFRSRVLGKGKKTRHGLVPERGKLEGKRQGRGTLVFG